MPHTRRQVVTIISILYLLLVAALSGYATSVSNWLNIPIPKALTISTTVLPIIAGFFLEIAYDLNRVQEQREQRPTGSTSRPPLVIIANTIIFIYSTVVITLLGTHAAPPASLNCGLEERWKLLWTHKKSEAIKTIQQTLNCCGFVNSHDRAWPFPDKSHDVHACESAFGYQVGCVGPWKAEEQRVAGILMGVVGLVFAWQVVLIATPTRGKTWLHRVLPDRVSRHIADEEEGSRPRRAIDYLPNFDQYRDNVAEEVHDSEEEESAPRRVIENGARTVGNALIGSTDSDNQQHASHENAWARTD